MKKNNILFNTVIFIFLVVVFISCEDLVQNPIQPNLNSDPSMLPKVEATYAIKVTPSKSTIQVGDCLYFTINVTQNGKAVSGVTIGGTDPIKAMCIVNMGKTNSQGQCTYYVESMCPAKYNDRVGVFEFTFTVGTTTVKSDITINTKNPVVSDGLTVSNKGKSIFNIKLTVNNHSKGTILVSPGQTINLFTNNQMANSTVVAIVLDKTLKELWRSTIIDSHVFSPLTSNFLNPYYNNYHVSSKTTTDGNNISRNFSGASVVYKDGYTNKQLYLGNVGFSKSVTTTYGVAKQGDLGITGPGCETFVGLRTSCSYSCGASAGLEFCASVGASDPIEPLFSAGCGVSCCVEVATVSCQLFSASESLSATYNK